MFNALFESIEVEDYFLSFTKIAERMPRSAIFFVNLHSFLEV